MAVKTSRTRRDEGVALVEFALILPIFMMLILGMFTGGIAYNRKLAMTNASREAARFGATYPVVGTGMAAWLDKVAEIAVGSAEGEMAVGVPARSICVAYVSNGGTPHDTTSSRRETAAGVTYATTPCYTDGQPANIQRVQVVLTRTSTMQAMLFRRDLTLTSRTTVRFEASQL